MEEVKAKGGKSSLGQSEAHERANRKHSLYKKALSRVGVVNSEESARKYRCVLVRFGVVRRGQFEALGYPLVSS